jgi:RND family efflux transporter MFP subunit
VGVGLTVAACGKPPEARRPPPSVTTAVVTPARFSQSVDTISTMEALEEVALAAQAGGRVERLLVRQGDVVKAGQLLMVLDQTQLQAEVASLTAQVEKDRLNYERFEFLVRQGAASALQRDQFRAQYIETRESLRARRADLAYRDLRAPISGIVGDVRVKIGDVVQKDQPFTSLIRNDRLVARLDVPGILSGRVRPGMPVVLHKPLGEEVLARGVVRSVDPGVNPTTQALLVKAEFANPTGVLRAGLRLRTSLQLDASDALSVPFAAVTQSSGQNFVFQVGDLAALERMPGKAKLDTLRQLPAETRFALQVPVQLGPLQNNRYPVLRGLSDGDRVITSNILSLRHGMPVSLK